MNYQPLRLASLASLFLCGSLVGLTLADNASANQTQTPTTIFAKLEGSSRLSGNFATTTLTDELGIVEVSSPRGIAPTTYARYLDGLPGVVWAEADGLLTLTALTPNDLQFGNQTGITQTNLTAAWSETTGDTTQSIGVIDTGINGRHEDLLTRVVAGYDYVSDIVITAGANSDDNGHGTAVAGIIGATGNNQKGMAGVVWAGSLVPLKVADKDGVATAGRVAKALTYAADNKIKIVNLSLGSSNDFAVIREAITYAAGKNVTMVAAVGNDSGGPVLYPAAYPDVIAVGSVNSSDVISSFSNSGSEIDLVAPGENILTPTNIGSNGYTTASGTSVAAPFVTGTVGLFSARFPNLSPAVIRQYLIQQTDQPVAMNNQPFTTSYGYGRVNAAKAVSYHATFAGQNTYPILTAGSAHVFEVKLANTGAATWYQDQINLATDRVTDRIPRFIREDRVTGTPSGWLNQNRVRLVEPAVAAGQVGTFRFAYTVPTDLPVGTYPEYFRPVADGLTWLENLGIYWDLNIVKLADTFQSEVVWQSPKPTLTPGQAAQFEIQLKNTGSSTWQKGTVNLGTNREQDRIPRFIREDRVNGTASGWLTANRVSLVQNSAAPGEVGIFRFAYTVPADLPAGVYREYFQPVADTITWLPDHGIFWDVTVTN